LTALRNKLIKKARERFLMEGFYKISMDELSAELKMSKKTIYSLFPSKNELIREVTLSFLKSNFVPIRKIVGGNEDAIVKLSLIMNHFAMISSQISTNFLKDMQTHMEELWIEVETYRSEKLQKMMTVIITQGQKENLFKPYPADLVILLFVRSLSSMVTPATVINYEQNIKQLARFTIEILVSGILTEKGSRVFEKYKLSINT